MRVAGRMGAFTRFACANVHGGRPLRRATNRHHGSCRLHTFCLAGASGSCPRVARLTIDKNCLRLNELVKAGRGRPGRSQPGTSGSSPSPRAFPYMSFPQPHRHFFRFYGFPRAARLPARSSNFTSAIQDDIARKGLSLRRQPRSR